ncbi:hypothetical protein MTX38_30130 [Rhodococcus sp. ARC_M13]|uniref:hypothetical protein n=1 Tax=Rhodococcus TaxID=1827 RepID=UPI0018A2E571|nr:MULTISPECIES: hypothetical protein [Rhodococcus]MBF7736076.1 hypothetical protein [Rhodococcus erythropolis]MCJ0901352.1 hypothetical protein [Rhodococcus sp. ARC_M13]MCZ4640391.1 hypothetical protein [Rhodococcus erythropolis]
MTIFGRRSAGISATAFVLAAVVSTALPAVGSAAPVALTHACTLEINDNSMSLDPAVIDGWYDISTGSPGTKINSIEAWRTVPGDILEFRASVTIRAHGSPVRGTLRIDGAGLTGDQDLISRMTLTQDLGRSGSTVTDADDGSVIPVRAKLAFDVTTPGQVAQNQTVNLSAVKIVLAGDTTDPGGECPGPGPGPGGGGNGSGGGSGGGDNGSGGNGGESGDALPGRDVGNRVPISQIPSGPTSRP